MKSKHGKLTGEFGSWLTDYLNNNHYQHYSVYYDHGDKETHKNVSVVKGFCGEEVTRENKLTDLDIIVVNEEGIAILLIEIEESKVSPKVLLGDMFATLLSDRYAVKNNGGQFYFDTGSETRLIIASVDTQSHAKRKNFEERVMPKIQELLSGNETVKIGEIEFIFGNDPRSMIKNLKDRLNGIFPL